MTRPAPICRDMRIGCPFCDYMAVADWMDEALKSLRMHAKKMHGHALTSQEAAVLARGTVEKRTAV